MEPLQALALQAILGSDYRRETLNWFRLDSQRKIQANSSDLSPASFRWNILYHRKLYT